jgi:putative transposase
MFSRQKRLHQKVNYLHHNPVRIGVVARPEDWLYSSAGNYAGSKGLIELDTLD